MKRPSLLRRAVWILLGLSPLGALAGCCMFGDSAPLRDLSKMLPAETVALFAREEAAVSTLQGEVKASIDSPQRSGTLQAMVLVRRPHSFRMRAYPRILGGTVFDLSIRKDRLEFFVPSEETVYAQKLGKPKPAPQAAPAGEAGPPPRASPEGGGGNQEKGPDLDSLFGSTSLARMILGTTIEEDGEVRYLDREEGGLHLVIVNADGVVEGHVWLDPVEHFKTRQVVVGKDGKIALTMLFEDYELHEPTGIYWPEVIAIQAPKEEFGLRMVFDVDDLGLNEAIEEAAFDLEVPEGTKRVERKD